MKISISLQKKLLKRLFWFDVKWCKLQLLVDYGLMKPLETGTYYYLPILQRSIDKTSALIERFMKQIDAQKMSIPILTHVDMWKESGE